MKITMIIIVLKKENIQKINIKIKIPILHYMENFVLPNVSYEKTKMKQNNKKVN